ncbi:MAG: DUF1963 domain-containing protein, partial [Propionibacteriaceae bacterium]|nr:DUF1963 domain-containing protein [Propionibacteriaceae bacterium]
GVEFPQSANGPMQLIGQFNFDELPTLEGFPETGILQLFIGTDDIFGLDSEGGSLVRYLPDASAPSVGSMPLLDKQTNYHGPLDQPMVGITLRGTATAESISRGDRGLFELTSPGPRVFLRKSDAYRTIHTVPWGWVIVRDGAPGQRWTHWERNVGEGAALDAARSAYLSLAVAEGYRVDPTMDAHLVPLPEVKGDGDKLGGYPFFTQEDPRESGDERILLAQIDTGEGLMWGDSGVANWFIHPDDLAQRDFSKVQFNWDCY